MGTRYSRLYLKWANILYTVRSTIVDLEKKSGTISLWLKTSEHLILKFQKNQEQSFEIRVQSLLNYSYAKSLQNWSAWRNCEYFQCLPQFGVFLSCLKRISKDCSIPVTDEWYIGNYLTIATNLKESIMCKLFGLNGHSRYVLGPVSNHFWSHRCSCFGCGSVIFAWIGTFKWIITHLHINCDHGLWTY